MLVTPEVDGAPQPDPPQPSGTPPRRSPGVRFLWRLGGGLFAFLMLAFGVSQVIAALAHEQRRLDSSYPAAGIGIVEIHNDAGGQVEVVGSDTDAIRVRTHIHDGLIRTDHSEQVVGDRLVLDSGCPELFSYHCSVSYVVEAPVGVSLMVSSDSGHLEVSDIDGNVDVRSDAGGIDLSRIGGSVHARSDAGGVNAVGLRGDQVTVSSDAGGVHVDFAEEPLSVVATSDAGSVEVVVPRGTAEYKVTADSDAGSVTTEVETSPFAERTIVATTDAGSVTVRYRTPG